MEPFMIFPPQFWYALLAAVLLLCLPRLILHLAASIRARFRRPSPVYTDLAAIRRRIEAQTPSRETEARQAAIRLWGAQDWQPSQTPTSDSAAPLSAPTPSPAEPRMQQPAATPSSAFTFLAPSFQRQLSHFPYRKRAHFLSPAEQSFYTVLTAAIGADMHLLAKVRLIDLLDLPTATPRFQHHFYQVVAKHVDFVLCDRQTLTPLLVIELDDSSHLQPERRERDAFVDQVLATIALPIRHVPVRSHYRLHDLTTLVNSAIPTQHHPTVHA